MDTPVNTTNPATSDSQDGWLSEVYFHYNDWKQWSQERTAKLTPLLQRMELSATGVRAPASLLEVGYGDGSFLKLAHGMGFTCTGLELSNKRIATLKALGIDARVGSIKDLENQSFDLIAAFDVFEYMTPEQILINLRSAREKIKDGGKLIARFPNCASPFGAITQFGDITHRSQLSGDSFCQLASIAGFSPLEVRNAAWTWRGNSLAKTLVKPVAITLRRLIELIFGFAYYGRRVPLDPEVVVILQANHSIPATPVSVETR